MLDTCDASLYEICDAVYRCVRGSGWSGTLYRSEKIATWKCPFPETTHEFSIARLETLTILLAVIEFKKYLNNSLIINLCDNQNSVWAFDKDGSRDLKINDLVIRIIDQVRRLKSLIQVIWLPTKYQLADAPSRDIRKSEEFLPKVYFQYLERLAGIELSVDCLATQANAKCPEYVGLKPTELEGTPYFDNAKQIFIDFNQLRRRHVVGKNLYLFPPKNFLTQTAANLNKYFLNHPFVLLVHRWEEMPVALTPLIRHKKSILVCLTKENALTFFPAEKTVTITHLPDGKKLNDPRVIRGQPNVRPRSLMAIFHCCQPSVRLVKGHHSWFVPKISY